MSGPLVPPGHPPRRAIVLGTLLLAFGVGARADGASPSLDAEPDPDALAPGRALDLKDGPEPPWLCPRIEPCVDDYLAYPTLALAHSTPIPLDEVWAAAERAWQQPAPASMDADLLREQIIDGLAIRALLEQIDERPLEVTRTARRSRFGLVEERFVLHDPWVGTFTATLALPGARSAGPGPAPALLVLPGHLDDAEAMLRSYSLAALAYAGFALLIVEPRADDSAEYENLVARSLLVNGHTLLGLRAYEALLGLRLLRELPTVDASLPGLVGHSGGSVLANVLVRVEPAFAALVTDAEGEYWNLADEWAVLCESVPDLVPLRRVINRFSSSETPVLHVPYGYENAHGSIVQWLRRRLDPLNERWAESAE